MKVTLEIHTFSNPIISSGVRMSNKVKYCATRNALRQRKMKFSFYLKKCFILMILTLIPIYMPEYPNLRNGGHVVLDLNYFSYNIFRFWWFTSFHSENKFFPCDMKFRCRKDGYNPPPQMKSAHEKFRLQIWVGRFTNHSAGVPRLALIVPNPELFSRDIN